MKLLRNILTAAAIILAVGAILATPASVTAQSKQKATGDQGTLLKGTCTNTSVTIDCDTTSANLCDKQDLTGQWWRYFSDASCSTVFKRP